MLSVKATKSGKNTLKTKQYDKRYLQALF